MFEKTESKEILIVTKAVNYKQENEFLVKCPHCNNIRGIDKADGSDSLRWLGGEQFQDNLCDGWYEISREACLVDDVEKL